MDMPRAVGMEIKALSNLFKRQLDRGGRPPEDAPTGAQAMIIHYLYDHQEKQDIFQRDLEIVFSMRRPTATGVLQLMEKNGLLRREPATHDARLKRLVLTEKALCLHEEITRRLNEVEALAVQGLTAEEIETFFCLTEKIRQNLSDPGRAPQTF